MKTEYSADAAFLTSQPGGKGTPLFYAQGCVRKLAAVQHAPRAASRERNLPYSIALMLRIRGRKSLATSSFAGTF